MENNEKESVWHPDGIAPSAKKTLLELREESILSDFYLAGGTGLALHFGHRRSLDLDFFSGKRFNENALLKRIEKFDDISLVEKEEQTLYASIAGTKVSFLAYEYPMLFPFESFLGVRLADARDTACMKISTIMSRGKKRDFIDLYVVSHRYGLKELLRMFERKYAKARYNLEFVLKSLVYFEDAEDDPMPEMLKPISWEEVKAFFSKEVPKLR